LIYVNVKDEAGPYINYMANKHPSLINRSMFSAAKDSLKGMKDRLRKGRTRTVTFHPLSKMRTSRRISKYHNRPHSNRLIYGRVFHAVGRLSVKSRLQVRFGFRGKGKAQYWGNKVSYGYYSRPVTAKQQRHLAAIGYKVKKGHRFKHPPRNLYKHVHKEEQYRFFRAVEKNMAEKRKTSWKKDINRKWKHAYKKPPFGGI